MTRPAYWDHMSDAHAMRLHAAEAAVTDAIKRLGGHPDSQLEGEGGLAAAVAADRARLERGIIAERDRLKARHAELMKLADRAERRRKTGHEGSQLIAMAREMEPSIAALTVLADDGCGLTGGER